MNRRRIGARTLVAVVGRARLVAVSSRNAASAPARAPHDASGIAHIESGRPFPFALGELL
jgi:hypothetical protein